MAVMLSLMGNKTYGLLRNLAALAKARLALKEGSQPKFCKARPVPYAMKPKVEVEMKRLEKEGIPHKVKFGDWATPIVPVAKSNGTVRICGDYKTTVNPQLQTEEYPLPRIDYIFAKLAFLGLVNYFHKFLPNLATTLNLQGSSNVNEITKRFSFNLKYVMPLSLFYHCSSVFRDKTSFGWELTFFPISVALRSSFWRSKGFV